MRRIKLVVVLAVLMAALLVVSSLPAAAADTENANAQSKNSSADPILFVPSKLV